MRAAIFHEFGEAIAIEQVADPACPPGGAVIQVRANGLCLSDWHGWVGHDPAVRLPHVPGHELAGVVVEVDAACQGVRVGDRVTVPFVVGCGGCPACHAGQQQICHDAEQPGFTTWGAFADYVAIGRADLNLVPVPEGLDFAVAASLGCRFTTAFRATLERGRLAAGEWLAVHGCGGVGLSAIMIARAAGAGVVAVDIDPQALELARGLGAAVAIDPRAARDVPAAIKDATGGGAHVSIDAIGRPVTCENSVRCLRPQGRHVQAGLLAGDDATPPLPMDVVVGRELEILGTHGMAAHRFAPLLTMITDGRLAPEKLIRRSISLGDVPGALMGMDEGHPPGMTVMEHP